LPRTSSRVDGLCRYEWLNVAIEYRWANYHYDRFAGLATDLVEHRIDVIAVTPPVAAALAAKAATQTVPIMFVTGADPVAAGLVSSINRPSENTTGITFFATLGTKNLELVRTLMPSSDVIGFFYNPNNPSGVDVGNLQAGAESLGQQLVVLPVRSDADIGIAFSIVADRKIRAILKPAQGQAAMHKFYLGQTFTYNPRKGTCDEDACRESVFRSNFVQRAPGVRCLAPCARCPRSRSKSCIRIRRSVLRCPHSQRREAERLACYTAYKV
jgi:hypothetical protein